MNRLALLILLFLTAFADAATQSIYKRDSVDFDRLAIDELYFPQDFLFGFAIAEQQNSGAETLPDSNWSRFEKTMYPDGRPHIQGNQRSGKSCDHWNLYQTDIQLMKEDFNANAFRFSVDWSKIEPQEGVFSEEALSHYSEYVDALLNAGIKPMVTLHHFSHPIWFEDKGAFEKEENIAYFVRFSQKVFEFLGNRVPFWCTINEPTIYMFQGYLPLNCVFPPLKANGFFGSFPLAVKVLRNMMQAHTEVYHTLKALPGGDKAQIGLVHQYLKFEGYTFFNPAELFPGFLVNNLMINSVIDFLKTGTFDYWWPWYFHETYTAPAGKVSDFVGLNYYSRALIEMQFSRFTVTGGCKPWETMTDMPYAIYPRGIYDALIHVAEIGLPIYITENGIADENNTNDVRRVEWFRKYLKAVSLALEDGVDIRGYFCWTLTDNFEWDAGFSKKFGLYSVNYETFERKLKEGAHVYARVVKDSRAGKLMKHTSDDWFQFDTNKSHYKIVVQQ
jgi:beta-glucosidase